MTITITPTSTAYKSVQAIPRADFLLVSVRPTYFTNPYGSRALVFDHYRKQWRWISPYLYDMIDQQTLFDGMPTFECRLRQRPPVDVYVPHDQDTSKPFIGWDTELQSFVFIHPDECDITAFVADMAVHLDETAWGTVTHDGQTHQILIDPRTDTSGTFQGWSIEAREWVSVDGSITPFVPE